MHRGAEAGRHLGRVRVVAARMARGEHDPGHLDLALDRAVQVEVPVEAVVVVADGGEERHDEPALPPRLRRAVEDVGVLPEDAEVLLVDADRVAHLARLAGLAADDRVQVGDLAEAVAAELERVDPLADQVLAGVEVRLPVAEPRIAVRHHHLRHRSPVDHRPPGQLDLVQGEPLARVEAHPQRPVLPAQQVALHREARPLRLGDLDRPQRRALRPAHRRVVVVAGFGGHRQLELVDDPQHLLLDQVHVRGDPVDGVRPGQVVLAWPAGRRARAPSAARRPRRARGRRPP